MSWSWLRFATAALGVAAGVVGVLVPATGPVLLPAATGLIGLSLTPPGSKPRDPQ